MDRSAVRLALWLVAVLFAVAMSLAPASAHPGHADHGQHGASHRHVDTTPSSVKGASSVESAAAELIDGGCHGACCCGLGCCGMGCCMACIVGQSPTLSLHRAAVECAQALDRALSSVEPDSLLEPPNVSA